MPPPADEAFARLFRRLHPAERRGFVADLWAARGWETEPREWGFLAVRDGTEQRVRVTDSGRFGTPTVADADVLVSARDRAGVRDAAREAGATYLSPADVREMLLYGVDRGDAAALFEETFDRPLHDGSAVEPGGLGRLRKRGSAVREAARDRFGDSRVGVSVLLVVLLVGAAVGPVLGPVGIGDRTETLETVTFTPGEAGPVGGADEATGTDEDAPTDRALPPGVGTSGISDVSTLIRAHKQRVRNQQRTLRVAATGPPNATFMSGRLKWNYTIRVEHAANYRIDENYVYPNGTLSSNGSAQNTVDIEVFANGGVNYRRRIVAAKTDYLRYPTEASGDATEFAGEVGRYLDTYLRGERTAVDCVGQASSPESFVCRVIITGAPETLPDAESYRATAVIRPDGVVVSFTVSYTLPDADGDGERETVRLGFAYESFGETTVPEPDWLPEAKNATAE